MTYLNLAELEGNKYASETDENPPGRLAWEPDVLDWQIAYNADLCARDPKCSARTDALARRAHETRPS